MAERPDLIDTEQLLERLDSPETALRRLQARGAFPPPDLHFRSHPIWWWDRVEHWKRQRRRTRAKPFRRILGPLDLVDSTTTATRLGVRPRTIEGWLSEGHMIEPDYRWSHTTAWQWQTVERWIGEARGRVVPPPHPTAIPVTPVDLPAPEPVQDLDPFEAALAELRELQHSFDRGDVAPQAVDGRHGLHERLKAVEQFIERVDDGGS